MVLTGNTHTPGCNGMVKSSTGSILFVPVYVPSSGKIVGPDTGPSVSIVEEKSERSLNIGSSSRSEDL